MRIYWDTCALIWYYARNRVSEISGVTRPHSLSEMFSGLTGGGIEFILPDGRKKHVRFSLDLAARVVSIIRPRLDYVDLTADEIVAALKDARRKNARGGRVHDLMHAIAAEKARADELWTTDQNDFEGLGRVPLKYLSDNPEAASAKRGQSQETD